MTSLAEIERNSRTSFCQARPTRAKSLGCHVLAADAARPQTGPAVRPQPAVSFG
jgi:hypothetical protein